MRDNILTQINGDNLLQTIKDSSLAFDPHQSLRILKFLPKLNHAGAPAVWGYSLVVSFKSKGKLFLKISKPV